MIWHSQYLGHDTVLQLLFTFYSTASDLILLNTELNAIYLSLILSHKESSNSSFTSLE